ncbi:FMN-binding protein [Actinoplanes sp. N902-109]|uniref:FMN-binding protein n=1 Tax=Actinoplanes sp. (strain N902-109) TaxID=649831 RepID=UPI0003294684|nr:FMN-binding protein [Actinoplanes sp. N902-109]AGL15557.1 hypothetical protein L083_2047 [Actinoplanes sp. N902-109]
MRRITLWLFSTVAALVLLFSYRTSTGDTATASTVAVAAAPLPTATPTPTPSPSSTSSSAAAGSATKTKSYPGSVAQTRWGPVQVSITVANGRITDVQVPTYPNGNGRDVEINASALPVLQQETLAAQSADIDTVSGATVTSDGYIESLQAALDAAHLS